MYSPQVTRFINRLLYRTQGPTKLVHELTQIRLPPFNLVNENDFFVKPFSHLKLSRNRKVSVTGMVLPSGSSVYYDYTTRKSVTDVVMTSINANYLVSRYDYDYHYVQNHFIDSKHRPVFHCSPEDKITITAGMVHYHPKSMHMVLFEFENER